MSRQNQGKPKIGKCLLLPHAMEALAGRIEFGEQKYTPAVEKGWLKYDFYEVIDSLQRHLTKLANGESRDEDGLPHTGGLIFNACILEELIAHSRELNRDHDSTSGSELVNCPYCYSRHEKAHVCDQRLSHRRAELSPPSSDDDEQHSALPDSSSVQVSIDTYDRDVGFEKESDD